MGFVALSSLSAGMLGQEERLEGLQVAAPDHSLDSLGPQRGSTLHLSALIPPNGVGEKRERGREREEGEREGFSSILSGNEHVAGIM